MPKTVLAQLLDEDGPKVDRYFLKPHGVFEYETGRMEFAPMAREAIDAMAAANHRIRAEKYLEVLTSHLHHDTMERRELEALSYLLSEELPVPLMYHLLKIKHQTMRFTVNSVGDAMRLARALRNACSRMFGDLTDYVTICEYLSFATDMKVADYPEMDAMSIMVDFTFGYGASQKGNRYLRKWQLDAPARFVLQRMYLGKEPFFWVYCGNGLSPHDSAQLREIKFLPVKYVRCKRCGRGLLPPGDFVYDKASPYFDALLDHLTVCTCCC
jgi:hypothetical protein